MMTRDELILSFDEEVTKLSKQFNYGVFNPDLYQEGMICVITAVDKSLAEGINTREDMLGRVIRYVKNRFIDIRRKPTEEPIDPDDIEEATEAKSLEMCLVEVKNQLTDRQNEIFEFLLNGTNPETIASHLGCHLATVYREMNVIKEVLRKNGQSIVI